MFRRISIIGTILAVIAIGNISNATHVTGVTIDPLASFNAATDEVTITGTVSCNDGTVPITSIDDADVIQGNNKNKPAESLNNTAGPFAPCDDPDTVYSWSITVASTTDHAFRPGLADVTVTTDCCDDDTNSTALTASRTVQVRPAAAFGP